MGRIYDLGTDEYRALCCDGVLKLYAQFRGDPDVVMDKEAVRHRPIQEQADDASVERMGVPFKDFPAAKFSLHASIWEGVEIEMESR